MCAPLFVFAVGGNKGNYAALWGLTELECQRACQVDTQCLAIEFGLVKSGSRAGYTTCKMQHNLVRKLGVGTASCLV